MVVLKGGGRLGGGYAPHRRGWVGGWEGVYRTGEAGGRDMHPTEEGGLRGGGKGYAPTEEGGRTCVCITQESLGVWWY